jgi:hypothetical protein
MHQILQPIHVQILLTYGAFAAGRDFCSIIVTKNFKLTLLYDLIYGSYGMQKSSCGCTCFIYLIIGSKKWQNTQKGPFLGRF